MRSLHFVALLTLVGYAGAQPPHSGTAGGVLDREMAWTVSVGLPGDEASPPLRVKTMNEALSLLDRYELGEEASTAIIAFMDSSAVELHRIGTPTLLFWCDEVAMWNEKEANEAACHCAYACIPHSGRTMTGMNAFNERARLLLKL